jgi:hypothetical protein
MNDELNSTEEQALDALLFETLNGAKPPDLTEKILASWRTSPAAEFQHAPTVLTSDAVRTASRAVSSKSNIAVMFTVIAGLAAALLIAFTLRDSSSPVPPSTDAIASQQIEPVVTPAVEPVSPKLADHATESTRPPVAPRRGIPLVIGGSSDQPPTDLEQDDVTNSKSDKWSRK